ncbi:MAG: hypothetical protein RL307_221, partial [Pseudomonadota bacterium]
MSARLLSKWVAHAAWVLAMVLAMTFVTVIEVSSAQELAERHPQDAAKTHTVNFQVHKLDVRTALNNLAEQAGINLVMSDAVKGQLSLHLQEVPWRVALDAMLAARQLGVQHRDGIWWVAPLSELAAQEKRDWERRQALDALEPLVTRAFVLRYARAVEVHGQLMGQMGGFTSAGGLGSAGPNLAWSGPLGPPLAFSPGSTSAQLVGTSGQSLGDSAGSSASGPTPSAGLAGLAGSTPHAASAGASSRVLSPRGSVMSEPRTNQLFVTDINSRLDAVADLLRRIDVPQRQVMIEARVVEASTSFGES